MNPYEKAIKESNIPTNDLLEKTSKPLHRAILLNYWRHILLEGSGQYDAIVAPDMMVENPVYRVNWGQTSVVVEGKDAVVNFYSGIKATVLWHSDDLLSVADWGICNELTFHQIAIGAELRETGYSVEDPGGYYHVQSRQAFIWPYDERALLKGEHLYEDRTSLKVEQVDEADLITPAQKSQFNRESLSELESSFGENFWHLDVVVERAE